MLRTDARMWAACALACALGLVSVARAQEGAPTPPTLPEVEVNPTPDTTPGEAPPVQDNPFDPGDNEPFPLGNPFNNFSDASEYPGGSLLQGGIFSNAPARGYRAPGSVSSSLIETADADIPGTVNSITRGLLNDQQALQIGDVVRNAGATISTPNGGGFFYDQLLIRGLTVGSRDYRRDGFLDPTLVPRDFQNIDRIEIFKGPASMLYGVGSPSGMVNLITKKPVDAQFTNMGYMFGAYQQSRYMLDTNGRATESGNVLYRFNGMQEDRNNFTHFDFLSRTDFSPSVTWLVNDSTAVTYQADWHRDDRRGFQGIPAVNGNPLALPASTFVGLPGDYFRTEEFRQSLTLTHQLSDDWTFRIGGSTLWYNYPAQVTRASDGFGFLPDPSPFFYRAQSIGTGKDQSHSMIANVAGDFMTGELRHRAVAGVEYSYFDSNSTFRLDALSPDSVNPPTYTSVPFLPFPIQASEAPVFRQQRVGVYLQDLVDITPQWKVLGGVRVDSCNFTYDRTNSFLFFPPQTLNTEQEFYRASPRGGLIFQPFADESLAYYFNYSESFAPPGGGVYSNGTVFNPTPLKPILGRSYEAGFKTTLLDNLTFNAAAFHITRNNADLYDGASSLFQVGEERSQGCELNLIGNITDRWNAVANYTYADVRLYDPNFAINGFPSPLDGQRQRNVPFNSANIWTRYNLVQDSQQTFGVALGMVASGNRPGDLNNTFFLPRYCRWDTGLFYNRGQLNANVYIENVFNTYYDNSAFSAYQIYPGNPFNARATVSYFF